MNYPANREITQNKCRQNEQKKCIEYTAIEQWWKRKRIARVAAERVWKNMPALLHKTACSSPVDIWPNDRDILYVSLLIEERKKRSEHEPREREENIDSGKNVYEFSYFVYVERHEMWVSLCKYISFFGCSIYFRKCGSFKMDRIQMCSQFNS